MKPFAIIVAVDEKMGIGRGNALPWRSSRDMQRFKDVTVPAPAGSQNAVIMGRRTWESLPLKYRPLPGRLNVVLSSQADLDLPDGVVRASSLDGALVLLDARKDVSSVFVIGGGVVFALAVRHQCCTKIFLTKVLGNFSCDVFFPAIGVEFKQTQASEQIKDGNLFLQFFDFSREV